MQLLQNVFLILKMLSIDLLSITVYVEIHLLDQKARIKKLTYGSKVQRQVFSIQPNLVVTLSSSLCLTSPHCPSLRSLATHPLPKTKYSWRHCSYIHSSHLKQWQGTTLGTRPWWSLLSHWSNQKVFAQDQYKAVQRWPSTYLQDLHVTSVSQSGPWASWIPKGADACKMQYPCFHIAPVFQDLCPSQYPKFC